MNRYGHLQLSISLWPKLNRDIVTPQYFHLHRRDAILHAAFSLYKTGIMHPKFWMRKGKLGMTGLFSCAMKLRWLFFFIMDSCSSKHHSLVRRTNGELLCDRSEEVWVPRARIHDDDYWSTGATVISCNVTMSISENFLLEYPTASSTTTVQVFNNDDHDDGGHKNMRKAHMIHGNWGNKW